MLKHINIRVRQISNVNKPQVISWILTIWLGGSFLIFVLTRVLGAEVRGGGGPGVQRLEGPGGLERGGGLQGLEGQGGGGQLDCFLNRDNFIFCLFTLFSIIVLKLFVISYLITYTTNLVLNN